MVGQPRGLAGRHADDGDRLAALPRHGQRGRLRLARGDPRQAPRAHRERQPLVGRQDARLRDARQLHERLRLSLYDGPRDAQARAHHVPREGRGRQGPRRHGHGAGLAPERRHRVHLHALLAHLRLLVPRGRRHLPLPGGRLLPAPPHDRRAHERPPAGDDGRARRVHSLGIQRPHRALPPSAHRDEPGRHGPDRMVRQQLGLPEFHPPRDASPRHAETARAHRGPPRTVQGQARAHRPPRGHAGRRRHRVRGGRGAGSHARPPPAGGEAAQVERLPHRHLRRSGLRASRSTRRTTSSPSSPRAAA